ncbi:uncharacterized protein MONBRDRAFT_29214 [Monosiga brevicollis MX1]|uniref:3-demethylubiquinol 3-O-methyltransferase n=1 Tax=Monosiga brevicollis TaxID=81824 RepID=A9VAG1_MONBE|nr:uncharacterized protein MONBRDRAFT_29214 [Monosiga brevicollis MX1]EDQ85478.1 predicted protein [Monosiga brevicollis MX1]|eukprot:XP_001749669.1 hypothetical protein [Monosiga brevicollis MX1]
MASHPVTTIDPKDTDTFKQLGHAWWDRSAEMYPLHHLNPARLAYIARKICEHHERSTTHIQEAIDAYYADLKELEGKGLKYTDQAQTALVQPRLPAAHRPLAGISVLDIGCGGGILSESMAYLGAEVKGIDSVGEALPIARVHARAMGLSVDYEQVTAEALAARGAQYDVVLVMEVIEHVANVPVFVDAMVQLTKSREMLILSTPNRNWLSWLIVIFAAEDVLGLIPKGMHTYSQFIRPEELLQLTAPRGLTAIDRQGFVLDVFRWRWFVLPFDWVDYIVTFIKNPQ